MAKFVLTAELKLQAPRNAGQVVNQLQSQLKDLKVNISVNGSKSAVQQIKQVAQATSQAASSADKMGEAFGVSLKRFTAFSIASRAIGLFTSKLSGAVDEAIAFQNELVRISQVTGKTLNELKGLTDQVTQLSVNFGVSSKEILGVATTLAQAGIAGKDLEVAINALAKTKLAPTFGDIQDTAEGAVAVIAQFGEGVGALERQLGAINRVSADFAVESEDLISVIQRTGGVFKASGGNLEELLALFTSVRATTRESAESIATGLRTIFTRIQRPATIEYLKQFGVELTDLDGKFVGPYEAVRQLSEALSGLGEGDIRFIKIAEELGGFRQIGKVIPLLQKFEVAERARQSALKGGESLDKDVATAQQSLAVQFTKVREEFLALIRSVSETSSFQILVKTSLNLASALIKIADALKPLIPLLATLATIKFAQNIGGFLGGIGAGFSGLKKKNAGGKILAFASGGLVPGSGNGDTVPAMLSPGEFVIRKSSVNSIGADTLHAMNKNRYKDGGKIQINPGAIGGFFLNPAKGIERDYPVNKKVSITNASVLGIDTNNPTPKDLNAYANALTAKQQKERGITQSGKKVFGKGAVKSLTDKNPLTENIKKSFLEDASSGKAQASGQNFTLNGSINGFLAGGFGSLKKKSLVSRIIGKNTETALKNAVNKSVKSVQKYIDIPPINSDEEKVFESSFENLLKPGGAKETVEGYILEGVISGLTNAKLEGGQSRFDFPKLTGASKQRLAAFFGVAGGLDNLVKADAKRTADPKSFSKIVDKLVGDINKNKLEGITIKRASGGGISGSDTVPALLTPGEFVINKGAAQNIGYGNLNRMNKQGVTGFAKGGAVGVQKFAEGGNVGKIIGLSALASLPAMIDQLAGPVNDTSTALRRMIDSIGGTVTNLSTVALALQAFGIQLSKQSIMKAFDKNTITKIIESRFPKKEKKIISPADVNRFNELQRERKAERGSGKERIATRKQQANRLTTYRSAIMGDALVGEDLPKSDDFLSIQQDRNKRAEELKKFRKERASLKEKIPNASFSLKEGPISLPEKQKFIDINSIKQKIGKTAGSATRGVMNLPGNIAKAAGSVSKGAMNLPGNLMKLPGKGIGALTGLISGGGGLSALAGGLTAAATGAIAAGAAFKAGASIVDSYNNYQVKLNKAIEQGNSEQAATIAVQKSAQDSLNSFGTGLAAGGAAIGSIFGPVGTVVGGAIGAIAGIGTKLAVTFFGLEESVVNFATYFGGPSLDSIKSLAQAQATAAKFTKDYADNARKASEVLADIEAGRSSFQAEFKAGGALSQNLINAGKASAAAQKASNDQLANKSTGGFATARDIFSLGGTLFESSGQRNMRIDEENKKRNKEAAETLQKEFDDLRPSFKGLAAELTVAGKSEEEFIKKLTDAGIIAGLTTEQLNTLKKDFKNQAKATKENIEYLNSLNFGLRDVRANLGATSAALDYLIESAETGANSYNLAARQLEASVTEAAQSMNPKAIANAQQTLADTLAKAGASPEQVKRAQGSFNALTTAQQQAASVLSEFKGKNLTGIGGGAEKLREDFSKLFGERLRTAGVGEEDVQRLLKSFNKIEFTPEMLGQIQAGNIDSIVQEALGPMGEALNKEMLSIVKERGAIEQKLIDLTRKRIDAEANAIQAQKQAIDIQIEANEAIADFGGPIVTTKDRVNALNKQLNLDLGFAGVGGVGGGNVADVRTAMMSVQSNFAAIQRGQTGAIAATGGGTLQNAAGVNADKRPQLESAQQQILDYTRKRIDLIKKELELADRKNALEKSAIEKLVGGDIQGFIEEQSAAAAANLARSGNTQLLGMFDRSALAGGLKSLEGQGLSKQQIESASGAILSRIGGTQRMAQVFAGTTPQQKALMQEGQQFAGILKESGQNLADMQLMKLQTANMEVTMANININGGMGSKSLGITNLTGGIGGGLPTGTGGAGSAGQGGGGRPMIGGGITPIATSNPQAQQSSGFGIGQDTITTLTTVFNNFATSVDKLQNTKFLISLDPTNININFNGTSFLANLKSELQKEVLGYVAAEIPKYTMGNDGTMRRQGGVV